MDSRLNASRYQQIHEGMDVLDRDGNKIGKAGETLGNYFNVDAGFLGMKEYYVPFDAVTEVQDDAVFVDAYKDDLGERGWDRRPEERTWTETDTATTDLTDTTDRTGTHTDRIQLREEELRARKSSVEAGHVQLSKDVVEEQRTVEVPVAREEVFIERHPVERHTADTPIGSSENETIRVPVREEQVEVEKQPVVYEEVGVGKRRTEETQQVSDTVRREELRTNREGDVDLRENRNA
jgi:uncharacterized protein (TIGR02271 family)